MRDPFPASPKWLSEAAAPLASYLNLPSLPLHIHEILITAVFYHWLFVFGAPWISKLTIPSTYAGFNTRTRINWNVHIVSFVQSLVVCSFALWVVLADSERDLLSWQGRVFGYTGATGVVQALGAGYFFWDLYICVRYINIFGVGMLAHAISAVTVFLLGFRPFVNYYAPCFILYELSSPFLNIHWACDKLHLTGSIYQLINGVILIVVFFGCRLIYGSWQSILVMRDIYTALRSSSTVIGLSEAAHLKDAATLQSNSDLVELMRFYSGPASVPLWLPIAYLSSNLVLNSLNWYWFGKMITTIKARFEPEAKKVAEQKEIEHKVEPKATGVQTKEAVRKRRA